MSATTVGPISLSIPNIAGNEWSYVKECLDTGWVSSVGSFVDRFERDLAARAGTQHAIATASGTAAIHTALMAAGVEKDDEVLMPSLTFIAPANAVRYIGAWPVFLDSDPVYWQLDPNKVEVFLRTECVQKAGATINRKSGRTIKAIMPVHVLGHPAPLKPILELAGRYGLVVIEDATESLGSTYEGRPTGSWGLIGCFSFNGNKIITTGGGGMIVTHDKALADRCRYLTTQAKDDPVEFVHGAIGYNYRMTNVQAAIGCAQLEQLDKFINRKKQIAECYAEAFGALRGWTLPQVAPWASSNWWLYTVRINEGRARSSSRAVMAQLQAQAIQCRPFWQPMHLSPAHLDCQAWNCGTAEALWRDCLSIPCSTNLDPDSQQRVIAEIQRCA